MRWIVATVVATVALVLVVFKVFESGSDARGFCVATVGDRTVEVDLEQAKWAALMAAKAQQRGLPPRATTIAIATAYQESKIRNIDYGDRDSVGLFQQRPSQGWGTVEQILDPQYSITKFYDALEKLDDYESMEITDAAQAVQRSGFPEAYADHEADARVLASSLRGFSPAAFACSTDLTTESSTSADLEDYLNAAFGRVRVDSDPSSGQSAIALTGEDVDSRGWALAQFLVANSTEFRISEVTFDDMRWEAGQSEPGWEPTEDASRTEVRFVRR
ncbi:hypothetical protein [Aeromicrobium choanae]|uniref:Uncharacterized protein n=1 Tax=Aeromicrobium choanae TaxID=1736691 RepID=A0A1T4YTN9_9ACTN|nr:hypothetical protein [Aeromicrobium choanae]SKB04605.1 hypothetical protein SAMN06295964_0640 [Aeromicrobium choanae]